MERTANQRRVLGIVILVFLVLSNLSVLGNATETFFDICEHPLDSNRYETLYVGGSGSNNYSKIQDAVENASDGDRIYVYQGLYSEHVLIAKNLTLLGESRDETIIDGGGTGNVIKIQANSVTVSGFGLQNGGIGAYLVSASDVTITDTIITNNWEGLGLLACTNCVISENTISHNGFEGINPVQTTFTTISGNQIIDHLQGIYLVESTDNTLVGNVLSGNMRGIEVQESSDNNHLFHNNFYSSEENNAYDTCNNIWDDSYPSGGNYWDDYTGGDSNHDGIGDTPYSIPGGAGNKDYYPLMSAFDHAPTKPSDPNPSDGASNVSVNPMLSVFVSDADQDSMDVSFYDASTHQVIGVDEDVPSASRASFLWEGLENNSMYQWYAVADDGMSSTQSDTWVFTTGSGTNLPPSIPLITGQTSGNTGQTYEYQFLTEDPEGQTVLYYIDWGDSSNSGWIGPFQSGELVNVSHSWTTRGTYLIKAKTKDVQGAESGWGSLSVKMPICSVSKLMIFIDLFENFFLKYPHAFPFFHHLFLFKMHLQ